MISLFIISFHYIFGTKSRSIPRAKPRSVPRAMPRGGGVCVTIGVLVSASLDEQFMSGVEGWRRMCPHWSSRLGFARRTVYGRSRGVYPERCRGVEAYVSPLEFSSRLRSTNSLWTKPRSVHRAKSRGGGINIGVLVSSSLYEQFMSGAE